MKELKFKTSKGEFLVNEDCKGISLKEITELEASEIVDDSFNAYHEDSFKLYGDEIVSGAYVVTAIESLHSLLKSKDIHLFENPVHINVDDDKLCDFCPLEKKGVYGTDGGYMAGCEGSRCDEARDNYFELHEEAEEKTFYNPYIFKL